MPTLQVEDVPEAMLSRLSEQARRDGLSVREEVLRRLGSSLDEAAKVEATLEDLRQFRASLEKKGVWMTPEEIRSAKEDGRA